MLEFVVVRRDGDGLFDLPYAIWKDVLHPNTVPYSLQDDGNGRQVIEVNGYTLTFVDEMPGLAVAVECENIQHDIALELMEEICTNIANATGHSYELLEMPTDRPFRFS